MATQDNLQSNKNLKPLTDVEGEVRELELEDFLKFKPSSEVLPESLQQKLGMRGKRGKQKSVTKEQITIRLSPENLDFFKAQGSGWQTRIDDVLTEWRSTQT
jgi:uncharacterized protein (DUF4415 family)